MKKESEHDYLTEADMRLLVPAYALYIKHLQKTLAETRKRYAEESNARDSEDVERDKVIFEFVREHLGREKLLHLGKAIDDEERKRTGKDSGCLDCLETWY